MLLLTPTTRALVMVVGALGAGVMVPTRELAAQQTPEGVEFRRRVTVALVAQLPVEQSDYVAVVVRRRTVDGGDLILLRSNMASGATLDAAARVLLQDRAGRGNDLKSKSGRSVRQMMLGVRLSESPADWNRRLGPAAQRVVDSLFRAPARQVANFGSLRAIDFYLPRTRARPKSGKNN